MLVVWEITNWRKLSIRCWADCLCIDYYRRIYCPRLGNTCQRFDQDWFLLRNRSKGCFSQMILDTTPRKAYIDLPYEYRSKVRAAKMESEIGLLTEDVVPETVARERLMV